MLLFGSDFKKMCADVALQRDLPWELDSMLRTLGRTNLGDTLGTGSDPQNFGSHIRTFRQAHVVALLQKAINTSSICGDYTSPLLGLAQRH